MVNLDDMQVYKRLDPANMMEHLHGLPRQCRTAWLKAQEFQLPKAYAKIDKVVVLGMGGSAIGGSLLRNLASRLTKPIIFVTRDYDLPALVDDRTLVIASSYSGNTEETLSAFSQALKTNCKKLVTTTGGKLKDMAEKANVPVFIIDHSSQPRAALGYSFMPIMAFLRNLGFLEGIARNVEAMTQGLEKTLEEFKETVPA